MEESYEQVMIMVVRLTVFWLSFRACETGGREDD